MATEYFIMAGDVVIDQVDVGSSDNVFFDCIRTIKGVLSNNAREAFQVVSEYAMYPDEGAQPEFNPCSDLVVNEIELAWANL